MEALQGDVQAVFYAVLSLVITIVTAVLAPGVRRWLQARYTHEQIREAERIARIVVGAAEQVGTARGFDGHAKFADALTQARRLANRYGLDLSDDELGALIERAVHEISGEYQLLTAEDADSP